MLTSNIQAPVPSQTQSTSQQHTRRFRDNPFASVSPHALHALLTHTSSALCAHIAPLASLLIQPTSHASSAQSEQPSQVYNGSAGLAWLLLRLHEVDPGLRLTHGDPLRLAQSHIDRAITTSHNANKHVGFLASPIGAYAIAAAIAFHIGNTTMAIDLLSRICSHAIHHAFSSATHSDVFSGRAGLLYAYQFLTCHLPLNILQQAFSDQLMYEIVDAVIEDGCRGAKSCNMSSTHSTQHPDTCPLVWGGPRGWSFGSSTGIVGILTTLMGLPDKFTHKHRIIIFRTAQFLAKLNAYPQSYDPVTHALIVCGNSPSTNITSESRHPLKQSLQHEITEFPMVQWCHGAPGFGLLFVRTCEWLLRQPAETSPQNHHNDDLFDRPSSIGFFSAHAFAAGELTWEQGVVDKYIGLCHGVTGNAYLFAHLSDLVRRLDKYIDTSISSQTASSSNDKTMQVEGEELPLPLHQVWLDRAFAFASLALAMSTTPTMNSHDYIITEERAQLLGLDETSIRKADHPFSLFEGIAGLVALLLDLVYGYSDTEREEKGEEPRVLTKGFPCYMDV